MPSLSRSEGWRSPPGDPVTRALRRRSQGARLGLAGPNPSQSASSRCKWDAPDSQRSQVQVPGPPLGPQFPLRHQAAWGSCFPPAPSRPPLPSSPCPLPSPSRPGRGTSFPNSINEPVKNYLFSLTFVYGGERDKLAAAPEGPGGCGWLALGSPPRWPRGACVASGHPCVPCSVCTPWKCVERGKQLERGGGGDGRCSRSCF